MKAVWKYPIEIADEQLISMPTGAEIICVQMQHGKPCLWVLVDGASSDQEQRRILVRGTGHFIGPEITKENYIGTFQMNGGVLIFHVFAA